MTATATRTLKFTAVCTACKKQFEMTKEQLNEAHEVGCAFSPCCHTVATVDKVEVRTPRKRERAKAVDPYMQPGWELPKL
jgi:hypothetical protein